MAICFVSLFDWFSKFLKNQSEGAVWLSEVKHLNKYTDHFKFERKTVKDNLGHTECTSKCQRVNIRSPPANAARVRIPALCHMWLEFVVGSRLATRLFDQDRRPA